MPLIGQDDNPWILGCEMTVDGDCQMAGNWDEDTASSVDGFMFGGSNSTSEYVTTNETPSGNGDDGFLSSNTNNLPHSVSLPSGTHTLGSDGREARHQNPVNSYTTPRSGPDSIPRSLCQIQAENIYGSSPNFLSQQPSLGLPFMDLNEKNLGDLHPHLKDRERLSETKEWVQRGKISGKSVPYTEEPVRGGPTVEDWNGEGSSRVPRAQNAVNKKLRAQYGPDSSDRSGTEHRQMIKTDNQTRTRKTTDDEEDASKVRKEK